VPRRGDWGTLLLTPTLVLTLLLTTTLIMLPTKKVLRLLGSITVPTSKCVCGHFMSAMLTRVPLNGFFPPPVRGIRDRIPSVLIGRIQSTWVV